ncbi:hypothetical protein FRB99_002429, partial [Tulasnella sp. 403]
AKNPGRPLLPVYLHLTANSTIYHILALVTMSLRFSGRLFLQNPTSSADPLGSRFTSNLQSVYDAHNILTLNVIVNTSIEEPPADSWVDVTGFLSEGTGRMMANLHITWIKAVTGYSSDQVSTRGEFMLNGTVHKKSNFLDAGLMVELSHPRKWFVFIPYTTLSEDEYGGADTQDSISFTGDFLGLAHRTDDSGVMLTFKPTRTVQTWVPRAFYSSASTLSSESPPPTPERVLPKPSVQIVFRSAESLSPSGPASSPARASVRRHSARIRDGDDKSSAKKHKYDG